MIVTVTNPDAPFDSPAYDGQPELAYYYLAPGKYPCTGLDYAGDEAEGTLVVTDGESHLTAWTDANGNEYRTSTTANAITVGSDIALPPGTSYTVADVSEFDPTEVDAVGSVATATDIDENGCICGRVTAAEQDGELTLITILIEQSPPWTFSVPAATPVYVV